MRTILLGAIALCCAALPSAGQIGIFEAASDVGVSPLKGTTRFEPSNGEYRVAGSGANIWATADAFQFVHKKVAGDFTLTADVRFVGPGTHTHRKAALMARQTLDADSAYADTTIHGDGLTALQFRATAGAITQEVRSGLKWPIRLRLERRGDRFTLYAGAPDTELKPAGPATVSMSGPVYVGLAMCSHDVAALDAAIFSNVKLETGK
jgi:TolB protein